MKKLLPVFLALLSFEIVAQQFEFTPITLSGPSLQAITDITGAGDGSNKLYIVEKRGVIRIVQNNEVLAQEFLSITNIVMDGGERGLLGLAFHPSYPDSPYIYVNYVIEATITTRIARFTVPAASPNNANEASVRIIMDIPGIETNHKAGDLAFGPDGYLYITTGDGGGGGDPQDTGQDFTRRLGKILRVDINSTSGSDNYSIPSSNPYLPYTGTGDTLPEIFMNGVRNPWRMSFDSGSGDIWIADVGQNLYEEVHHIPAGTGAGRNLGWDCMEGLHNYSPSHCDNNDILTLPILEYNHCPDGPNQCGQSITGGFVYRGNDYPDMIGKYIAVDYSSNDIWEVEQTGGATFNITSYESNGNDGITTFGEDDNGELFAGNLSGVLFQVTMGELLPIVWEALIATPIATGNKIQWTMFNTFGVNHFELQRSHTFDFANAVHVADVLPIAGQETYSYLDPYLNHDGVYYRIAAHFEDGSIELSPLARILPSPLSKPTLTFDINTNQWRLRLPSVWQNGDLTLFDLQGRVVYKSDLEDREHIDLSRPIPTGVYFIMIRGKEGIWSQKIVK